MANITWSIRILGSASQALGFANGEARYLTEYQPHTVECCVITGDQRYGRILTSPHLDSALVFACVEDALGCVHTVSRTLPWRPDGEPNKPLLAFHLQLVENRTGNGKEWTHG